MECSYRVAGSGVHGAPRTEPRSGLVSKREGMWEAAVRMQESVSPAWRVSGEKEFDDKELLVEMKQI